jgi:uncharacterized protein YktA (UPF0223 family)
MNSITRDNVPIPRNWTGEQAKAVLDFLDEIASAIWDVHEKALFEEIEKEKVIWERNPLEDDDHARDEDDLPF